MLVIEADQCGLRIREAGAVFGMLDIVDKIHSARCDLTYPAADADEIIVPRGVTVAQPQIGHDQPNSGRLKFAIAEARLAQVFGPGDVQPDDVPRMVHDAHLVGFGIIDAYGGDGFGQRQAHMGLEEGG